MPDDEQTDGFSILACLENRSYNKWGGFIMSFVQVNINEKIEKHCNESPSLKKTWEESREEYKLIGEMVSLRKKEKITQSRLAELTGNKQQVISRIEKKENSPSLRIFCNILDALGYELQIVKKSSAG